jgi:hypothetical protein
MDPLNLVCIWTGSPRIRLKSKRKRWLKMIHMKNWKELALNKKAWNNLVEKAKTHKVLLN